MAVLRFAALLLAASARSGHGERHAIRHHAPAEGLVGAGRRQIAAGLLLAVVGAASANAQGSNPAACELFDFFDRDKDGRVSLSEYIWSLGVTRVGLGCVF